MDNYRRFLELQKTDPQLRAEAMRRLGDLNLDAGEVERMEKEVTAIDMQGAEAIKLYSTLLKAYPDYARNDQVLYQLARAYETTGQPEQALSDARSQSCSSYPQSPADGRSAVPARRAAVLRQAAIREAQNAYAVVIQARRGLELLRAEPLQARLVAVQAGHERGEPAVLRRRARSASWSPRNGKPIPASRTSSAPIASWWKTRCVS